MSSFFTSTSPAGLRSVMLDAFSPAIVPTSVSPFFVVTFHCQKLGSTSRFGIDDVPEQLGAAVRAHAGQRRSDVLADVAELVAARAGAR